MYFQYSFNCNFVVKFLLGSILIHLISLTDISLKYYNFKTIDFHSRNKNTMEVKSSPELLCFPHSSEYIPLCSAEQRHSYRFGNTGWVNYDRIFIFGWAIPLNYLCVCNLCSCNLRFFETFYFIHKIFRFFFITKMLLIFVNQVGLVNELK